MFKPLSRTLLAFALAAPLPALAQQSDAGKQKELDEARAELQRAAKRVAELSRDAGQLRTPINIDQIIVSRPRLGVLLSGDDAAGVLITGVTPDSGAAKAGIKAGDRLLRVAGTPVDGDTAEARVAQARRLLSDLRTDTPVRVTYQREGKAHDADVVATRVSPRIAAAGQGPGSFFFHTGDGGMRQLDGVPVPLDEITHVISPEVQRELRQLGKLGDCKDEDCRLPALAEAFRWSNLNLASVDASLGRYFGTDAGVLVLSVGDALAGLQAGDVIRKVDGTPVATPRDVTRVLRDKPEDAKVTVEYLRDRQPRTSTVSIPKAAAFRVPATSRVTVRPRVAVGGGQAPTIVEKRRVMIIDQDGKVQTFEDGFGDAPQVPTPPAPPAPPSGKGGALL